MPWPADGRSQESQLSGRGFHLASSETIGTPTAAILGQTLSGIQNRLIKQTSNGPTSQPSLMHRLAASVQLLATCQIFAVPITKIGIPHWRRTGCSGRA